MLSGEDTDLAPLDMVCNPQKLWTSKDRVPPAVILVELYPEAMQRYGYPGGVPALLRKLHTVGYSDILHSGYVTHASSACMTGVHLG